MRFELRERLATEFAGVIKITREENWDNFCVAAKQIDLDPYVALARLLVRIVEDFGEKEGPQRKRKTRSKMNQQY